MQQLRHICLSAYHYLLPSEGRREPVADEPLLERTAVAPSCSACGEKKNQTPAPTKKEGTGKPVHSTKKKKKCGVGLADVSWYPASCEADFALCWHHKPNHHHTILHPPDVRCFFLHAPRLEIQQPTAPPEVSRPATLSPVAAILSSRFASRRRFPFPLQLDPFLALVRRCSHGPNPLGARCRKGACLSCGAACEISALSASRLIRAAPNCLPSPSSCSAAWLLASRDATSPPRSISNITRAASCHFDFHPASASASCVAPWDVQTRSPSSPRSTPPLTASHTILLVAFSLPKPYPPTVSLS